MQGRWVLVLTPTYASQFRVIGGSVGRGLGALRLDTVTGRPGATCRSRPKPRSNASWALGPCKQAGPPGSSWTGQACNSETGSRLHFEIGGASGACGWRLLLARITPPSVTWPPLPLFLGTFEYPQQVTKLASGSARPA